MVSSQMHWSLVIERTEESIRFSLELNWINLRRLRSAAGFLQGPLCPYGKKWTSSTCTCSVSCFFSHTITFSWKWPLLDFCTLTKKDLYTCVAGVVVFFLSFFPNIDLVQISLSMTCCYYHKLYCRNGISQVMVSIFQLTNTKLPKQFRF